MAATGVLTYAVHELFDRVIVPEVSKSSLLVKNQTLWRAVLSVPGLLVIEWLSRRFFSPNRQAPSQSNAKATRLDQKFIQFLQKAKRQRAVVHQVTQSHLAPMPPLKEQNGLTVFA
jgi:membrane protein implicated in regulation of membrane protease activity